MTDDEPTPLRSVADRHELMVLLSEQARAGKVTAAMLLLRELRRDARDAAQPETEPDEEPGGAIADLVARRRTEEDR